MRSPWAMEGSDDELPALFEDVEVALAPAPRTLANANGWKAWHRWTCAVRAAVVSPAASFGLHPAAILGHGHNPSCTNHIPLEAPARWKR